MVARRKALGPWRASPEHNCWGISLWKEQQDIFLLMHSFLFAISLSLWALHWWDIRHTCIYNEFSTMPLMLLMEAAGRGGQGWCWQAEFKSTTLIAWICFRLRKCFCGIASFVNFTNYEYKYSRHQLDIGDNVSKISTVVILNWLCTVREKMDPQIKHNNQMS